ALSITETSDVLLQFGDGRNGARLPTGRENIHVTYRIGSGVSGNVEKDRIKMPVDQPMGVQGVTNERATGGSEAETTDSIRRGIPAWTSGLGRIVSLGDALHFARLFPGVSKAQMSSPSSAVGTVANLAIFGSDPKGLTSSSRLVRDLQAAMVRTS